MTDWWNYGGLTRSVRIIDVPGTFVQDYSIQLEKGSQTRIAGWVRLNGADATPEGHRPHPRSRHHADASRRTPTVSPASPSTPTLDLWSPERPKLYDVTIESGADRVPDRIGFRTIEARAAASCSTASRCTCAASPIHAEAPFRSGRVYSEADARTLLSGPRK